FQPIEPFRNSDTRTWPGVPAKKNTRLEFGCNPAVIPQNAVAVAMNVAVIGTGGPGYLTIWPGNPTPTAKPNTSVVNFENTRARNGAITVVVRDLKFFLEVADADAHIIVDITGYWAS